MAILRQTVNGIAIPWDDLPKTYTYNPDSTINTITGVYRGVTYIQTFTYTSGNLTGNSGVVAQP